MGYEGSKKFIGYDGELIIVLLEFLKGKGK